MAPNIYSFMSVKGNDIDKMLNYKFAYMLKIKSKKKNVNRAIC